MKIIAHYIGDTLAITVPAKGVSIKNVLSRNGISNHQLVDIDSLPDREYRNAWVLGNGVEVDLGKAKQIHKDKIRKKRKPLLEALDIEYIRALEMGDKDGCQKISIEKQRLRDITESPELNNAKSLDELKAFMPF